MIAKLAHPWYTARAAEELCDILAPLHTLDRVMVVAPTFERRCEALGLLTKLVSMLSLTCSWPRWRSQQWPQPEYDPEGHDGGNALHQISCRIDTTKDGHTQSYQLNAST